MTGDTAATLALLATLAGAALLIAGVAALVVAERRG